MTNIAATRLLAPLTLIVLFAASVAFAQGSQITFPIKELGDCSSKSECKAYCDSGEHVEACISFGESHGLMSREEAKQAKAFVGKTGPGGCRGSACKAYCESAEHFKECRAFAEENGLLRTDIRPQIKVDEPKIDEEKALSAIEKSGGPGGCLTMDQCRAYCSDEGHMDTCMSFAREHNLMSDSDIERAEKFAHKKGPGGCVGEACKAHCENPDHAAECIAFAEENGFIDHEDAERAKAFIGKTGPGGCRGEECRTYCEDPGHREACMQFAIDNGFMSKEDADRMQGFENHEGEPGMSNNFQGPGGCSSPESCKTYCENHQDECRGFGQGQGPDHPVGQERAIDQRGFQIPPGLAEECKEHPEACRARFEGSGDFPKLQNMTEDEKAHMNEFIGRPEMNTSGEYPKPYIPEMNVGGEYPKPYIPGSMPSGENYKPPMGAGDQYQPQYNPEYQRQYDQQYPQQQPYQQPPQQPYSQPYQQGTDQQYQQPPQQPYNQQYQQPSGDYHPPEGAYQPSGTYQAPPEGQTFSPPPSSEPTSGPTSGRAPSGFVAAVFSIFAQLLQGY